MIYSSPMAQYVLDLEGKAVSKRIADFVDIDSDKWRQYSQGRKPPLCWIYAREAKKLLEFERRIANIFDATVFVSENEKKDFYSLAAQSAYFVEEYDKAEDAADNAADDEDDGEEPRQRLPGDAQRSAKRHRLALRIPPLRGDDKGEHHQRHPDHDAGDDARHEELDDGDRAAGGEGVDDRVVARRDDDALRCGGDRYVDREMVVITLLLHHWDHDGADGGSVGDG